MALPPCGQTYFYIRKNKERRKEENVKKKLKKMGS
jgi:hypothetical protein